MGIIFESLKQFWYFTGFANASWQNLVMILIGIVFITLAIKKEWEPLLLVPIGFGMIMATFLCSRDLTSESMRTAPY